MVWGCMVFAAGSMNSAKWMIKDANPAILAENNGTFKMTMPWFADLLSLKTGSKGMTFHCSVWPPQGPDRNPIKNVWYVPKNAAKKNICHISAVPDLQYFLGFTTSGILLPEVFMWSLYQQVPTKAMLASSKNEGTHHFDSVFNFVCTAMTHCFWSGESVQSFECTVTKMKSWLLNKWCSTMTLNKHGMTDNHKLTLQRKENRTSDVHKLDGHIV